MAFNVKKRGKLTYYYHGDHPVLSALVTEELPDGDLRISFAGLTGGYSAKGVLKLDELITAHYTLDQINEAVSSTESGEALRNIIDLE